MFGNVSGVEKWILDAIIPLQSAFPVTAPSATQGNGHKLEIIKTPRNEARVGTKRLSE
jgi:hypothetical protein